MKTETIISLTSYRPHVVTETFGTTHNIRGECPVVRFTGCDAVVVSLGASAEECQAIANLIANSPALLEVCEAARKLLIVIDAIEGQTPSGLVEAEALRAALAKAKGQP